MTKGAAWLGCAAVAAVAGAVAAASCTTKDCPDERIGLARCVGARTVERCVEGNLLETENCGSRGLFCDPLTFTCVPEGAGQGGATGTGGTMVGSGGTAGSGGMMAGSGGMMAGSGGMMAGSGGTGGAGGMMAGSGGAGGQGGSGGMGDPILNGCTKAIAENKKGGGTVSVTSADDPWQVVHQRCIVVSAGSTVTWDGNFSAHPLAGGPTGFTDNASPITAAGAKVNGMGAGTASAKLDAAGSYGYWCIFHGASMQGVVYVE
jgi:plastocyanin